MQYERLTVDGRRFEWGQSANGDVLHIRSALRAGQPLEASVSTRWPLGRQHVAQVIRRALRAGWQPTAAAESDEPYCITLDLK